MDTQTITLQFSYTPQDLREGIGRKISGRRLALQIAGIISWLIWLLILAIWWIVSSASRQGQLGNASMPADLDDLWLTLLPAVVPPLFFFYLTISRLISNELSIDGVVALSEPSRKSKVVSMFTGVIGGLTTYGAVLLLRDPANALPWSPTRAKVLTISFAPWILLAMWAMVFGMLTQWRRVSRLWKVIPSLKRPKQIELEANGITVMDEKFSSRFRWGFCSTFSETANLIRIKLEDRTMILIPKRAVAPEQMLPLRVMISERIPGGSFRDGNSSFPVISPQPVIAVALEPPPFPSHAPGLESLEPSDEASPSQTA